MTQRMSFLRYIGAKHRIAPVIARYLQESGATCLVDVFGGSGAVTMNSGFKKRVYNDIDGDLVNLFRVLADPCTRPQLLKRCKWLPPSRQIYEDDYKIYLAGGFSFVSIADKVERARATFYRGCFSFGGKMRSGGFQVSFTGRDLIKEVSRYSNLLRRFNMYGEFWRRTVIENKSYQKIISNYGRTTNPVLYFDPPYDGTEKYYSHHFTKADHVFLAEQITMAPAPAVGSYYDTPLVRDLYPKTKWTWHRVRQTTNSGSNIKLTKKVVDELILVKRMDPE